VMVCSFTVHQGAGGQQELAGGCPHHLLELCQ